MALRQKTTPNLGVQAKRGWCLMFVDDAVGAPRTNPPRTPSAQAAWNVENRNGNTRGGEPPVGVWVPIFFSFNSGQYVGLGHVAWAFNHGNGWIEIHDSETRTGARSVYRNIQEVLSWFGRQSPVYLGWSYWVDGVQAVEEFTPPVTNNTGRIERKGTATVISNFALPVCNEPTQASPAIALYEKGQSFNYDSYQINDGFVWLSYVSFAGVRRYVAEGPHDGRKDTVWVTGGVG